MEVPLIVACTWTEFGSELFELLVDTVVVFVVVVDFVVVVVVNLLANGEFELNVCNWKLLEFNKPWLLVWLKP